MGDEYDYHRNNLCNSGKWWDSTSKTRFETAGPPSTTTTTTSSAGIRPSWNNIASSMDSNSCSAGTSHSMFQDESSGRGGVLINDPHSNLQMMMGSGSGLNSQPMDWNDQHALLRSAKGEGIFGSFVQGDQQMNMNPTKNFHHQQGSTSNPSMFQMDHQGTTAASSSIYETSTPNPSTILHGLYPPNQQQQQLESSFEYQNRPLDHHHHHPNYMVNYDVINPNSEVLLPNTKFSHFMGNSSGIANSTLSPKQEVFAPSQYNQLHFSNVAPFWNASATSPATTNSMSDHVMPMSFPHSSLQQQQSRYSITPSPDEKSIKPITLETKASSLGTKKSSSETSMKRPRNEESSSPLPSFKVKKEKTTDKVTALQQLVSPFGKTDQASVFTAAIECIQFLHEKIAVLISPFMQSGAPNQHPHRAHQSTALEGRKQDLRSRELCLVQVASICPYFQETTVDFWTPTYGGTYR